MNRVKSTGLSAKSSRTKNTAGGLAYSLPDRERLVTGVLTSFFNEPKNHEDANKDLVHTARELAKTDPEFVAKTAVYARKEFHMRTISQVLAAEVAHGAKGNKIVRKMVRGVVERPDDMTNILAYWFSIFGPRKVNGKSANPVTRSLRRGIADSFVKFEEYHLAKYKSEKGLVKLRDALLICRPKPKSPEQAAMWKRLIEGNLEVPETRETILSKEGQSKEVWEQMIDSGKLGFMAMLRNLKNLVVNKVSSSHIGKVVARLTNKKAVQESKQLPFRFFSAYKMLENVCYTDTNARALMNACDTALGYSVSNMPRLKGTTFMTADESGSMCHPISPNSAVQRIDIGNLMMAIADGICDKAIVTVFGDKTAEVHLSKDDTILKKMDQIRKVGNTVGMSTRMVTAIDHLNKKGVKVDRIIVFSDMQAYDHSLAGWGSENNAGTEVERALNDYRKNVNPDVWVHSIDLSGDGTIKAKGPKVNLIAGWSEKIFDFIELSEASGGSLIEAIENYEI